MKQVKNLKSNKLQQNKEIKDNLAFFCFFLAVEILKKYKTN